MISAAQINFIDSLDGRLSVHFRIYQRHKGKYPVLHRVKRGQYLIIDCTGYALHLDSVSVVVIIHPEVQKRLVFLAFRRCREFYLCVNNAVIK